MKYLLIIILSSLSFSFYTQDNEGLFSKEDADNLKRGNAKYELKDYKGAIEEYNIVLGIVPSIQGYLNRADCKAKLEDYLGAIQDYNRAIRQNRKCIKGYVGRGLAKNSLADKKGACLDWAKAVSLGNEDAKVLIRTYCK